MTTEADRINAKAADEARATLHTAIDLDAFLALRGEARAARWRQFDTAAKFQLVAQQIERLGYDWMPSDVEAQIAKYDAKYAASATELAVEAALERLAMESADHARTARQAGEKADATFFQRAANAYTKALGYYRAGVRPEQTAHGWMLPSQRAGQAAHLLTRDGDWICTCQSGQHIHWASALIIGIEIAQEDQECFDEPADDRPGPVISFERRLAETERIIGAMQAQQLGRRLAEARQRMYAA